MGLWRAQSPGGLRRAGCLGGGAPGLPRRGTGWCGKVKRGRRESVVSCDLRRLRCPPKTHNGVYVYSICPMCPRYSVTSDKGWACSSLPVLRSFGKDASCNMPRLAPPPRSPETVCTIRQCEQVHPPWFALCPVVASPSVGWAPSGQCTRGSVSGETTSQLYALPL